MYLAGRITKEIPLLPPLPPIQQEKFLPIPRAVLEQRLGKGRIELLVHWQGLSPAESSWEDAVTVPTEYPEFVFEDKPDSPKEGDATTQNEVNSLDINQPSKDPTIGQSGAYLEKIHAWEIQEFSHQSLGFWLVICL